MVDAVVIAFDDFVVFGVLDFNAVHVAVDDEAAFIVAFVIFSRTFLYVAISIIVIVVIMVMATNWVAVGDKLERNGGEGGGGGGD